VTPRLTVELHCHTHYSADGLMRPKGLVEVCRRRGIDRVAITDHNTTAGALEAARHDPERVIVGEEILTTRGELLAYFVTEEVPAGLAPREAIARLRQQGAVISVSHPFDWTRSGAWRAEDLQDILALVDALEVFNARTYSDGPNRRAAALAAQSGLTGTVGSDAHAYWELGRAVLRLEPFFDAGGLRQALRKAEVRARRSPAAVHLLSRFASLRWRLGWRPQPSQA
jgi:predicted metal-dependent phosphoesterase TrpH